MHADEARFELALRPDEVSLSGEKLSCPARHSCVFPRGGLFGCVSLPNVFVCFCALEVLIGAAHPPLPASEHLNTHTHTHRELAEAKCETSDRASMLDVEDRGQADKADHCSLDSGRRMELQAPQ